jgi:transposase
VSGPSKYPEEFRRDAVELVLSSPSRTLRGVARELGVSRETLRSWVDAERARNTPLTGPGRRGSADGEELSRSELDDELRRLRKRLAEVELEKEILRKAAQYFAKEMGR